MAFLASRLTRSGRLISFNSAESSIVITLSSSGIYAESPLRNVVFPEPVPPEIIILYPATTSFLRNPATSVLNAPSSMSLSIVIGIFENFLMVIVGPLRAIGGSTILTLEPSESLASTIGDASFTILLQPETIIWIIAASLSSLSNCATSFDILPFRSMKISL